MSEGPLPAAVAHVAKKLSGVVLGQVVLQLLTVIAGLLLLRWLTVRDYAQYSLAFGFASTLTVLVDLGIPGSIVALVGERGGDSRVVGAYVKAAREIRNKLMVVAVPIGAVVFFLLTSRQDWGWPTQAALYASIAGTLYARSNVDFYTSPLVIHGRFGSYYGTQAGVAAGRVIFQAVLYAGALLTSVTAALLTVVANMVNGRLFRRYTRPYVDEPAATDPTTNRAMRRLIAPQVPSLLFVAFQGQIAIVIIAVVGATREIAEVGALSRLTQLFAAFAGVNAVLIAPYIARSSHRQVSRRIGAVVCGVTALGAVMTVVAFVWARPFLWLLGEHYSSLSVEVSWSVLGGALGFVGTVLYSINLARRFVWWGPTNAGLACILATQIVAALLLDLSTTLGVQYFLAATAAATVVSNGLILLFGLSRGSPDSGRHS